MTEEEFEKLKFDLKCENITSHSIYIMYRVSELNKDVKIFLYAIDNFFVEVLFDKKKEKVFNISSLLFDDINPRYLEKVSLSDIINETNI